MHTGKTVAQLLIAIMSYLFTVSAPVSFTMFLLLFVVVFMVLLVDLQISSVLFNHLWPQRLVKVRNGIWTYQDSTMRSAS